MRRSALCWEALERRTARSTSHRPVVTLTQVKNTRLGLKNAGAQEAVARAEHAVAPAAARPRALGARACADGADALAQELILTPQLLNLARNCRLRLRWLSRRCAALALPPLLGASAAFEDAPEAPPTICTSPVQALWPRRM